MTWTSIAPAVTAAFLASLVEAVEALTIVLAVATVRGWRPAGLGAVAGLVLLALIVLALGPLLDRIPLNVLQFVIGVLLLLFGMRWLRKAILRSAGVIPLHDEAMAFATETAELREQARRQEARLDWLAALASFKAVLLEGLEVVFIVIAVSAGRGLLVPASAGALAACLLVAGVGFVVHRPLARVPENTLKFAVGVMLSAFGNILDRRRSWCGLAGRGSRDRCHCGAVPGHCWRGSRPRATSGHGGFAMNILRAVFYELIGLFIDDGSLALEIVAVVVLAAMSAALLPDVPLATGVILLFGCLGVLLANVGCSHALTKTRPPAAILKP